MSLAGGTLSDCSKKWFESRDACTTGVAGRAGELLADETEMKSAGSLDQPGRPHPQPGQAGAVPPDPTRGWRLTNYENAARRQEPGSALGHRGRYGDAACHHHVGGRPVPRVVGNDLCPVAEHRHSILQAELSYRLIEKRCTAGPAVEQDPPTTEPPRGQHESWEPGTTAQINQDPRWLFPEHLSEPPSVLNMTLQRSRPDQADALGVAEHGKEPVIGVGHHHLADATADCW